MTNPFAPGTPAQQPQGGNPFAQPAQQQPPAGNPYGQPQPYSPPQQPQQGNPYGANPASGRPGTVSHEQHVQQTYQQTYQPQQAQQAPPPALDAGMLNAAPPPPPGGDGKGAKFPDMYGRLVIMFPLSQEQRPKNPQYITPQDRQNGNLMQDQITATVVVLDDGRGGFSEITWGGDPMRNQPPTDRAPLPYVRKAMWISQSRLIGQLRPFLPQHPGGAPGLVVGRVVKTGNEHNSPWFLETATENDLALCRQYLAAVEQQAVPHPLAAA